MTKAADSSDNVHPELEGRMRDVRLLSADPGTEVPVPS
jgi:hypothetical protein